MAIQTDILTETKEQMMIFNSPWLSRVIGISTGRLAE